MTARQITHTRTSARHPKKGVDMDKTPVSPPASQPSTAANGASARAPGDVLFAGRDDGEGKGKGKGRGSCLSRRGPRRGERHSPPWNARSGRRSLPPPLRAGFLAGPAGAGIASSDDAAPPVWRLTPLACPMRPQRMGWDGMGSVVGDGERIAALNAMPCHALTRDSDELLGSKLWPSIASHRPSSHDLQPIMPRTSQESPALI